MAVNGPLPWVEPAMGINASSALRTILRDAVDRGWTEKYLVRQIRAVIPLTERDRRAVVNYKRRLRADGALPPAVDRLGAAYALKLRTARAKSIAVTETAKTTTEANHKKWGVNDGAYVTREWEAKSGACVICQALDGQRRTGNKTYGAVSGPPCHPNCRCTEKVYVNIPPVQEVISKGSIDRDHK